MLQQLVQNLSSANRVHRAPSRASQDSWLSSSFDLQSGLTVVEMANERLPPVFADTMPFWMPGKTSPTQA